MVFKRILGSLGMGGPSVDTVLSTPACRPGGTLSGQVHIKAADYAVEIQRVTLGLVTRMESEHGDEETNATVEFHRVDVAGAFQLQPGQDQSIPFEFDVPWETPLTSVFGTHLHGMSLGVRTELAIAKAVDKGDLDLVSVEPLPSQQVVLSAFSQLGFQFKGADVEHGHLAGVDQRIPFYQEIEFYPPAQYRGRVNEVELTFHADPWNLTVILEADKRGGLFSGGHDAVGRFTISHDEALTADWTSELLAWLESLTSHGGFHSHDSHGHYDSHGHHGSHDSHGSGMGGVVAGAAVGFVGGMVAGEIVEEIFEDDEDEGGDED
ncbi:sporulation protein [Actinocorallia sp. B10E7]|uniref:sporulation protein n=1 Tax=Actinocorallia sp. B10E7 TaxID=3153558 RepID=UPI00325C3620